nr:hypothetical protein [Tanacetum cinerariifolium]
MGDANPIRTLGDYSKPSHEDHRNTIELRKGNPTTQMNFMSTNCPTTEELQSKGVKSPSKLLSSQYLSRSSIAERNRNPSSLKRVHFVNSIIILNNGDEAKEKDGEKSTTTNCKCHETTYEIEEEIKSEEEVKEETEEETKEEDDGNLKHFDTFPTVNELSVIDHYLGSVVFEKPFVEATGLIHNREDGTVMFERDKEKTVFKMPHKIDMFKHIYFADISTDRIPPFVIKSDGNNCEKPTTQTSLI